ncbi:putative flavin reductase [Actinosynnema pretiosum subsp. pretiosum]|nr:putative flavin reductase [Actinosynnema pretiosum subsp. pretiosum]
MSGLRLVVLGATGGVGGHVVAHALRRGHSVTALSRDPRGLPEHGALRVVAVDVRDRDAVAEALAGCDAAVSALGNPPGSRPGVLAAGAASLVAATPPRLVWLGAHGTGPSANAATAALLRLALGAEEVADKVAADALVLAAGGTVVHAGPLTGPAVDWTTLDVTTPAGARLLPLGARRLPRPVRRSTLAALLLTEAEHPRHAGAIALAAG